MREPPNRAKSLQHHDNTTLGTTSGKVVPDPPYAAESSGGSEPAATPEPAVPLFIAVLESMRRDSSYLSRNGIRSTRPTWELRAEALEWAVTQLTTTQGPNG